MSTTTTSSDQPNCFLRFGDRCPTNTNWKFVFGCVGLPIGLILLFKFWGSRQPQPPPPRVEQGKRRPAARRTTGVVGYTVEVFRKSNRVAAVECAICLRELHYDDKLIIVTACRHFYHRACLNSWLAKKRSCPLCRAPVGP
ncbi:unnamed protein product [Linum trigynum]|uniref:RING-type domain-containing protein n=1 Tax=Linum trigynum TaxID=586398 RepID=A0AAV2DPC3_9ROSI